MQAVLNFSNAEKKMLVEALEGFERLEARSGFEELRCLVGGCTVTLYKSGKLLIQGNTAQEVKLKILSKIPASGELVLGIDEAGRGESFGPLVVGGVLAETGRMRELRDSKKTRDIAGKAAIVEAKALGVETVEFSAAEIDRLRASGKNLNQMEAAAMNEIICLFKKRFSGKRFRIVVDGKRLKGVAKEAGFLVGADDIEPVVGAASVIAKNARSQSKDIAKRKSWHNWM